MVTCYSGVIGFPLFGYLMYLFLSHGEHFVGVFLITFVSIGIVLIGILQRTSEGQEEDLEKFLRHAFKQTATKIDIA